MLTTPIPLIESADYWIMVLLSSKVQVYAQDSYTDAFYGTDEVSLDTRSIRCLR